MEPTSLNEFNERFIEHYEIVSDKIFRLCFYKTNDREVALDLTQETFIKTWDYLREGKQVENLQAFTYTIARNLIKDFYKKKKSIPMGSMPDFDPLLIEDEYSGILENAEVKQLISLLDKLPLEDKRLLTYRLIDELSLKEIAEKTGERENTVSVRIHRALKRYREVIGGNL